MPVEEGGGGGDQLLQASTGSGSKDEKDQKEKNKTSSLDKDSKSEAVLDNNKKTKKEEKKKARVKGVLICTDMTFRILGPKEGDFASAIKCENVEMIPSTAAASFIGYCDEEGLIKDVGSNDLGAQVLHFMGFNPSAFLAGVRGNIVITSATSSGNEWMKLDDAQEVIKLCAAIIAANEAEIEGRIVGEQEEEEEEDEQEEASIQEEIISKNFSHLRKQAKKKKPASKKTTKPKKRLLAREAPPRAFIDPANLGKKVAGGGGGGGRKGPKRQLAREAVPKAVPKAIYPKEASKPKRKAS